MGVVAIATANTGDLTLLSYAQNTTVSTPARTGAYAYRLNGASSFDYISIPAASEYYAKVAFYYEGYGDQNMCISFREGSTQHVSVVIGPTGSTWYVKRGGPTGTLLGSGGYASRITWYCVEVHVKIHDTTGFVVVRINGVEAINLTNQDTQNGGSGYIDNLYLFDNQYDALFDDIVIRDDTWPGVGGVYLLNPSADGDETDWTPSAGSRYQCVDEIPPSFSDYIYTDASSSGNQNSFQPDSADLPGDYVSIGVVAVYARAQLDIAGLGQLKTYLNSNGTFGYGSGVSLSTSPLWVKAFFENDPDTSSPWASKSAVLSSQYGVEVV